MLLLNVKFKFMENYLMNNYVLVYSMGREV